MDFYEPIEDTKTYFMCGKCNIEINNNSNSKHKDYFMVRRAGKDRKTFYMGIVK
jgi:hypothetical protein